MCGSYADADDDDDDDDDDDAGGSGVGRTTQSVLEFWGTGLKRFYLILMSITRYHPRLVRLGPAKTSLLPAESR